MSADRAPWIAVDGEFLGARAAASGNSGRRGSRARDGAGALDAGRRQPQARQHQPSHGVCTWTRPLFSASLSSRPSPLRGAHGAAECGAARALPAPAWSCRRTRGGVTLGRRSSVAAARSFGALALGSSRSLRVVGGAVASSLGAVAVARRSGAAACGAALALPAPAWSCRRTRGGVTLGRRSSVAAARSFGARSARRLALSACGRWRGRFLSGGGRRRAALTAPLPAALRWRSRRRLGRAAAPAAA